MIKVLEHGNKIKEYTIRCDYCGCVFCCNTKDTRVHFTGKYRPHPRHEWADPYAIADRVIECPECGRRNVAEADINTMGIAEVKL